MGISHCWNPPGHRQVTAAFGRLLGTWAKRQLLGAPAAVPVEWMPNLGRLGKVEKGREGHGEFPIEIDGKQPLKAW